MIEKLLRNPLYVGIAAFLAGVILTCAIWGVAAATLAGRDAPDLAVAQSPSPGRTSTPEASASATPAPVAPVAPVGGSVDCPTATVTVDNAEDLEDAIDGASPGDVIVMAPGIYEGTFVARPSGTADNRIMLCGAVESVLDGGDHEHGYVFHLDGAQYWHLLGFSVRNGQKGIMADTTVGSIIESVTVSQTGDEAIHLRKFSTDNLVVGNHISATGLRKPKFGEGVYIGTAESNWCDISDCKPDNSDRNVIEGNTISGTSSESIDVKEGTSDGTVRNNIFDGSAIVGADSWVDIKGNDWLIEGNIGTDSPLDGFQTHEILDGWGTRNVFRSNTANVNGPGFGYSLTPERENVVECNNAASAAEEGTSNVDCS